MAIIHYLFFHSSIVHHTVCEDRVVFLKKVK